jgi:hypothetical protein
MASVIVRLTFGRRHEFHGSKRQRVLPSVLTDKLASTHDSDTYSYADKRRRITLRLRRNKWWELGHTCDLLRISANGERRDPGELVSEPAGSFAVRQLP